MPRRARTARTELVTWDVGGGRSPSPARPPKARPQKRIGAPAARRATSSPSRTLSMLLPTHGGTPRRRMGILRRRSSPCRDLRRPLTVQKFLGVYSPQLGPDSPLRAVNRRTEKHGPGVKRRAPPQPSAVVIPREIGDSRPEFREHVQKCQNSLIISGHVQTSEKLGEVSEFI